MERRQGRGSVFTGCSARIGGGKSIGWWREVACPRPQLHWISRQACLGDCVFITYDKEYEHIASPVSYVIMCFCGVVPGRNPACFSLLFSMDLVQGGGGQKQWLGTECCVFPPTFSLDSKIELTRRQFLISFQKGIRAEITAINKLVFG